MLPKNSENSTKIQFVTENYFHIGKKRDPLTEYIKNFQEKNVIDKLGVWSSLMYSKLRKSYVLSPSTKRQSLIIKETSYKNIFQALIGIKGWKW